MKHYRYSGKERDAATGLYYYGARYYAPWLGRWMSCDPAGTVDGLNLYAFVGGNPTSFTDISGEARTHGSASNTSHSANSFNARYQRYNSQYGKVNKRSRSGKSPNTSGKKINSAKATFSYCYYQENGKTYENEYNTKDYSSGKDNSTGTSKLIDYIKQKVETDYKVIRPTDAEAKVYEELFNKIKEKKRLDLTGTVKLYTSSGPCNSCRDLRLKFIEAVEKLGKDKKTNYAIKVDTYSEKKTEAMEIKNREQRKEFGFTHMMYGHEKTEEVVGNNNTTYYLTKHESAQKSATPPPSSYKFICRANASKFCHPYPARVSKFSYKTKQWLRP
ncbi:MAG: RHS repeat-associated core domain-containing protein [Gloeotrichia echinulata HAB0833]